MACLKHRQPLISYAELSSSLPASRSLWLAPTADAWRAEYIRGCYSEQTSSLRDLLMDDKNISSLSVAVDKNMARSAYLHGMAAQLWEYSQQVTLVGDSSDRSSQLWLQLRQEKLCVMAISDIVQICSHHALGISNYSASNALLIRLSLVPACYISSCRCMLTLIWTLSLDLRADAAMRRRIVRIPTFNRGASQKRPEWQSATQARCYVMLG